MVTRGEKRCDAGVDGTVVSPPRRLPAWTLISRRITAAASPFAVRSCSCSPDIAGSRTQTCKMARPAVATQTPSTLAAAAATGSHVPAMGDGVSVTRRAIARPCSVLVAAVAVANNSDNALARLDDEARRLRHSADWHPETRAERIDEPRYGSTPRIGRSSSVPPRFRAIQ